MGWVAVRFNTTCQRNFRVHKLFDVVGRLLVDGDARIGAVPGRSAGDGAGQALQALGGIERIAQLLAADVKNVAVLDAVFSMASKIIMAASYP